MEFLKLFQRHSEYGAFVYGGAMAMPNVSYCIEENHVHYFNNTESFRIFREVFCDNVNENDIEMFKNNVIFVGSYVVERNWTNPTTYGCNITFAAGFRDPDAHWETRVNCQVNSEITEEQYNEWKTLHGNELLYTVLPLFECQGRAEHGWSVPIGPS
jgi:hypothetical protein